MLLVNYNTESALPVSLFTSARAAITGATYSDVTCYFKKSGASTWTAKTLTASTWSEEGSGLYYITFTDSNLDTYGNFLYHITHSSGYFTGIASVTDYSTEATRLQDLYDIMATKVNVADILVRERELDNQITYLREVYSQLLDDIAQISMQINALKHRISQL